MSWSAETELEFGGEKRKFRLGVEEIIALQDARGVGIFDLYRRVAGVMWRMEDIRDVIKFGLEGGGMKPADAHKLMARYFFPARPLLESWPVAVKVMQAALDEPEDSPLGNVEAAGSQTETAD